MAKRRKSEPEFRAEAIRLMRDQGRAVAAAQGR